MSLENFCEILAEMEKGWRVGFVTNQYPDKCSDLNPYFYKKTVLIYHKYSTVF